MTEITREMAEYKGFSSSGRAGSSHDQIGYLSKYIHVYLYLILSHIGQVFKSIYAVKYE